MIEKLSLKFGRFTRRLTVLACAALLAAAVSPAAMAQDSPDPIKVILHDWTGHIVSGRMMGEVLRKAGYNVEYVSSPMVPAINAMAEGDLHLNAEQWLVSLLPVYEKLAANGQVVSLGPLGIEGIETLYYPAYVEPDCPGLPSWEALKSCFGIFATPETAPKGRLVDQPAEYTSEMPQRMEALGLQFTSVPAGGEGALIAEVKGAYARKQPVLVYLWEPHWIFNEYDLRRLAFPEWNEACEKDPAWGINPEKTFDCGGAKPRIEKVVWSGFEKKWPGAFAVVRAAVITNQDVSKLMQKVDVDGMKPEDAVSEWIAANQSKWQPWVDAAKK